MQSKPFSRAVLSQAESLIFKEESLRHPVKGITIDAEKSLDLDDAIWIEPQQEEALISVHIADPTAFILPDSPLDIAVFERVETLYLKHGNYPMLPHVLSENRLSLLENQNRATITIDILVDSTGEIVNTSLKLSVLSNFKQFSYQQADQTLNDPSSRYFSILRYCEIWAQKLNAQRSKKGAIGGSSLGGFYFNEDGLLEIVSYKSQQIIQEFMILANRAVAEIALEHKIPILFRNQMASPIAPERKLILENLLSLGIPELIHKNLQGWLNSAQYEEYVLGHFALSLSAYTHFTSPIRRLADYVNHRILKSVVINQMDSPYTIGELKEIARKINQYRQKNKIAKEEFFNRQSEKKLISLSASNIQFSKISDKDFSEIIKISLQKKSLANIQVEILNRLANKQLKPIDFYYLTFFEYPEKEKISLNLVKFLELNNLLISQYLQIASQIQKVELKFLHEEISPIRHAIWVIFAEKTTSHPAIERNKTLAKHKASLLWLVAYLKEELVDIEQRELPIINNLISEPDLPRLENAIGQLNDYLMKIKQPLAKYTFIEQDDQWHCDCLVQMPQNKQLIVSAQSFSKKEAKHKAALLILLELGILT
jgi:ribonuclease R